jgi:hypothetical protein
MRRGVAILALLAAAAALAACGGTNPAAGPEAEPMDVGAPATDVAAPPETEGFSETSEFAETGGGEPATTSVILEPDPGMPVTPPRIVLESEAGRQEAVPGSYCITRVSEGGDESAGVCTDAMRPYPVELSVVAPGEEIAVRIPHASIVSPPSCVAECDSTVTVRPLGCGDQLVATLVLGAAGVKWAVDVEPGAYQLDVFVQAFDDGKGTTGDISGSLGLLVDPAGDPAIIPVDESLAVCPYPEQP